MPADPPRGSSRCSSAERRYAGPRGGRSGRLLLACALVASHAAVAFRAATMIHINRFGGFVLFGLCWFSALYLGNCTLRLFRHCNYKRKFDVVNGPVESAGTA